MREIPDNINITETTNNNEVLDDVIFDEHYNDVESDDDDTVLPTNRPASNDNPSDDESNDDDEEVEYYNPNRMPKNSGNPNAKNLIGTKKDYGKGARNNQRQAISGSDSDGNDDLAHI